MPFRSRAQREWAFATNQPFARRWAAVTDESRLPERVPHSTSHFNPKHKARVVKDGRS